MILKNANFCLIGFSILISNRLFLLETNENAKLIAREFLKSSSDKLLKLIKKQAFKQYF